jgi:hypothetical protein
MAIYKVPEKSPNQRAFYLLAGVSIAGLLLAWFIGIHDPWNLSDGLRKSVGFGVLGAVFVAVILATGMGMREAVWKQLKTGLEFELTPDTLTQRRRGKVVIQFPTSSIISMFDWNEWLIVRSKAAKRAIDIPQETVGYDELVAELARISGIQPNVRRISFFQFAVPFAVVAACILLWNSHDVSVIRIAGAALIAIQIWTMASLARVYKLKPFSKLAFLPYALTLLVTFWLLYRQLH